MCAENRVNRRKSAETTKVQECLVGAIVLPVLTDIYLDLSEVRHTSSHGCVHFLVLSEKEILTLLCGCVRSTLCVLFYSFFNTN